jgi:hypothetical protein
MKKGGRMTQRSTSPISPRVASELLSRMRRDYRDHDFFADCCEMFAIERGNSGIVLIWYQFDGDLSGC